MKPTAGDIRCIVFGHLTRMAIWRLRKNWSPALPTGERLDRFARAVAVFGDPKPLIDILTGAKGMPSAQIAAPPARGFLDAVSF